MESDTKKINWDTYVEDGKHPCEGCIGCEHSNKVWGGVLCVAHNKIPFIEAESILVMMVKRGIKPGCHTDNLPPK